MGPQHPTKPPSDKANLFPEFKNFSSPDSEFMKRLIHDYQLEGPYSELLRRYSENEKTDHGFRLNTFRYIHRDPLRFPDVAGHITSSIEYSVMNKKLTDLVQHATKLMDESALLPPEESRPDKTSHAMTLKQYLTYTKALMSLSLKYRNRAFKNLSKDEMDFLMDHAPVFINHVMKTDAVDGGDDDDLVKSNMKLISLAKKIDYTSLLISSAVLCELADKSHIDSLKVIFADIEPDKPITIQGIKGTLLHHEETPYGSIIIGGHGSNSYNCAAALIIDIGGDDLYKGSAGSASCNLPTSILIDLNGDDHYTATGFSSIGSGSFGTGVVIDAEGDDIYTGSCFSQGAGFMGTGILADLCGNDTYEGIKYCQGVGFWGLGMLLDHKGDDHYFSGVYSQGVGGPKAVGLLYDAEGTDSYRALGIYPSSYGTSGIFKGASQGFGIGLRDHASGGIGMLIDEGGEDRFQAGNYSQGCGYYFGLGILKNSGVNNDIYIGSRYGQGASAHSAAGILIDDGGNDTYSGHIGALQSAAWDLGLAALIDKSGNDRYNAKHLFFSQAAAAHNGFSMLIDSSGADIYDFPKEPKIQSNAYHGGSSFSFLIDSGGSIDLYNKDECLNNREILEGKYGFIVDR